LALPIALLFSALVTVNAAAAELTLPPIFANEMILQRDKPVTVWGKSFAGDTITVSFGNDIRMAEGAPARAVTIGPLVRDLHLIENPSNNGVE